MDDLYFVWKQIGKPVLCTLLVIFVLLYLSAYMEAKTYTKLTGKEVSTWDAMWVKLRVEQ